MIPFYETRIDEIFAHKSYEPDFPLHLHVHFELLYIISGKVQITVDNQTQILSDGDMAIFFPNCIHGCCMVDSISSVDRLTIGVKPQLTGEFSKIILNFIPDNPYIYSDTVTEEMKHTLKRLFELNHECNKTEYSFIIIKSYMQILLGLLIPELNLKKSSPPEDYLLQKAVNYIFENFNEPLSLELVAKHIGTNKCHLSTVFSKKMHVVFNHYINDVRLNFAVHHLRNSDEPITKIAYDCGFGALRTFNRIFKNKYQITPNQFRNLQKTKQQ